MSICHMSHLQLHKHITDGEAPGEAGETAQPLKAELPGEQAAAFEPGPDVLAAQGLGLGHHLANGDCPPAQGGGQLPGDSVTNIGEPEMENAAASDTLNSISQTCGISDQECHG